MIKYYFIQFLRNIKRDMSSFFINIIGLSTAFVCVLFVYLWVSDEFKMDKFHEKDGQLFKVMSNFEFTQGKQTQETTPAILADALIADFPEVELAIAISNLDKAGIASNNENHFSAKGLYASKDLFNVLSINLLHGDKNLALNNKNNVIISEDFAKKMYSNTKDCIGKSLDWKHTDFKSKEPYTVAGVFNLSSHSSIEHFDIIFSLDKMFENHSWTKRWDGFPAETYIVLKKGADIEQFNKKIEKYIGSKNSYYLDYNTLFIQKYSDKYLHDNYVNGVPSGGRIIYVRLFSIIAIFIMIIASINYVNLATAKASSRLKELGVKKSIGANRRILITQYLSETMLISFLSLLIAFILMIFLLNYFNILTDKKIIIFDIIDIIPFALLFTFMVGLIAGSFPAFYISGFKPAVILKGKLNDSIRESWIRKGLVVFQFAISFIFILGFITIKKQIKFAQDKNLGYNRNNIICFRWNGDYEFWEKDCKDFTYFMSELKKITGVANATSSSDNILNIKGIKDNITWTGDESEKDFAFQSPTIGYDFIETLGIELIEGRAFSEKYKNENSKIIINESAVKLMNLENPIDMVISLNEGSEIIGVVKDFHYGSLHSKIEPLIFRFEPVGQNILVKIESKAILPAIEKIKELHSKFFPHYPFEFSFMDYDYQALYESENVIAILSNSVAIIAIIISCLGIFGLSAFSAQKKTKEIGIRKVHGSSSFGIIKQLSFNFIKPVLLSLLFAIPIGYYIFNGWLNSFAYRIDLGLGIFINSVLIIIIIALITVGTQTIKTANINPIISLKDE